MKLETVLFCPLGQVCEKVEEGKIARCAWFVQLAGKNPQTGEELNEHGCAVAWLPVLLVENANTGRTTAAAVESFRNEMVKANTALPLMLGMGRDL